MKSMTSWRPWALKCSWADVGTARRRSVREPIDVFFRSACLFVPCSFVRKNVPNIIYLYIYLSIYLSIHPSIHPSIYLSICLFIYLSIHPSIHLSIYLFVYLSIYLSIHPSIYLFVYLSIYLSIYPSIYLSVYLSIYLSISRCTSIFIFIYTFILIYLYLCTKCRHCCLGPPTFLCPVGYVHAVLGVNVVCLKGYVHRKRHVS